MVLDDLLKKNKGGRKMTRVIWNFTQHKATPSQICDGVVDLPEELRAKVSELLNIETPNPEVIDWKVNNLVKIADEVENRGWVMIGGAPFLMPRLEAALTMRGHQVFYAFSKRESVEKLREDGTVEKTCVFSHGGFVMGPDPTGCMIEALRARCFPVVCEQATGMLDSHNQLGHGEQAIYSPSYVEWAKQNGLPFCGERIDFYVWDVDFHPGKAWVTLRKEG